MIKKRIIKITKIGILVGLKEIWGLMCHMYLMTYQPFLTIKTIKERKDKSQTLLILMAAMLPFLFYSTVRVVTDYWFYGEILHSVGVVFLGVTAMELLVFLYLGYWTVRVIRE